MSKRLTKLEKTELGAAESRIEKGVQMVGEALCEIRDKRLYRATYETFEAYCKDRWGFTKTYANHLIKADKVVANLTTSGCQIEIPKSERQLREVAKAPEEKQVEVVQKANETAAAEDRKPTARDFAEARETVVQDDGEYDNIEPPEHSTTEAIEDKCGRVVPAKMLQSASTRAVINTTANKLNAIMREVDKIADLEGGEFVRASEIIDHLRTIKGSLTQSAYWTHCVRCDGKRVKCELCEGVGFIPERHKGYLNAQEKEQLQ